MRRQKHFSWRALTILMCALGLWGGIALGVVQAMHQVPYPNQMTLGGTMEPAFGTHRIEVPKQLNVSDFVVKHGDHVRRGDRLAKVDVESLTFDIHVLKRELLALKLHRECLVKRASHARLYDKVSKIPDVLGETLRAALQDCLTFYDQTETRIQEKRSIVRNLRQKSELLERYGESLQLDMPHDKLRKMIEIKLAQNELARTLATADADVKTAELNARRTSSERAKYISERIHVIQTHLAGLRAYSEFSYITAPMSGRVRFLSGEDQIAAVPENKAVFDISGPDPERIQINLELGGDVIPHDLKFAALTISHPETENVLWSGGGDDFKLIQNHPSQFRIDLNQPQNLTTAARQDAPQVTVNLYGQDEPFWAVLGASIAGAF